MTPIDPTMLPLGADWSIGSVTDAAGAPAGQAAAASGSGFGHMLAQQVSELSQLQDDAAQASQALATGTATDPSSVVLAVERAQLAMQLASQIRTKGVEAINDIFHTQV